MIQLRFLFRLVTTHMRMHPGRAVVTTLGIVASTCAVVWVVSGYDALVSQFDENSGKYLGRYDALVVSHGGGPPGSSTATIDPSIIETLKHDAGVLEVNPVSNTRVTATRVKAVPNDDQPTSSLTLLVGDQPPVNGAPPLGPTMVSTPADQAPYDLVDGQWLSKQTDVASAVVSEKVAQDMQLSVDEQLRITTFGNQVVLNVIGIVEQAPEAPMLSERRRGRNQNQSQRRNAQSDQRDARELTQSESPIRERTRQQDDADSSADTITNRIKLPSGLTQGIATQAIYVLPEMAAKINGYPTQPHVLQIAFRDTVTSHQFHQAWRQRLAAERPPLKLIDYSVVRSGMESSSKVSGQQSQAWAATGMASLAGIFIIFSTLSMGVSERAREFAMLRAIALTRTQIAGLIAIESFVLGLVGWTGGLLAGWIMVMVGSRLLPSLFASGAILGWGCILLTGITVLIGSAGAAILPAWRAMRIQPLDAMTVPPTAIRSRPWMILAFLGLMLTASTPIVVFLLPISDQWRTWSYSFLAYPMLLVGMILLAPGIVVACESAFAPLLTRALRLDSRMMKTQLSNNLWRSVGATLALSVGLGLYASTQTWGHSMLVPFTPGQWLPDALVAFHPVGLATEDEPLVNQVDGVDANEVMPLAIEQAKFDWGEAGQPKRLRMGGDNGIVCGLDPRLAFGGADPFLAVKFVAGDRESVIKSIEAGESCVVAEDFAMAVGLHLGDSVTLIPPAAENERVQYRIAGIVSLPGWQWVTKFSGVRRHFTRTGTILFASRDSVRTRFHLPRTEFFWLNFANKDSLGGTLADHHALGDSQISEIEAGLQAIAERHAGETFAAEGVGEVKAYRPFARMTATQNVKEAIRMRADGMIWGMSYLPLITLMVMSLAVANTVIAAVRSRTWEFGVMRSIGVTRSQLVRLVITETVLIGIAACALSMTFGLIAGWCGVGMAQFGGWFAGPPSFRIPWLQLSFGFTLALTLCLAAGLWPAIKTGRAEPLALLQAGRTMQ
ncbi:ABC transporter permease [Rubripirellula amarantea]|nr:ABC transporter permease [Rubripirellula amarantea]